MPTVVAGLWPTRATWLALPATVGPTLAGSLDTLSAPVRLIVLAGAWGLWVVVLVAVLVPCTVSLTVLRTAAPLVLVLAGWSTLAVRDAGWPEALALAWAALTLIAALAPTTGERFVDGSSYGDERRFPLRVPAPLLLGPLPVVWVAAVAAPLAGPLLLAARQWLAGAVVLVAGVPLAVIAVRALHGLARRWLVLVPAGLVVHDPATLADPVLLRRASIERAGLAPDPPHPEALDLSAGALGLVVALDLREPASVATRGRRRGNELAVVEARHLLVAPTRPGAVLAEAARRGIPVR